MITWTYLTTTGQGGFMQQSVSESGNTATQQSNLASVGVTVGSTFSGGTTTYNFFAMNGTEWFDYAATESINSITDSSGMTEIFVTAYTSSDAAGVTSYSTEGGASIGSGRTIELYGSYSAQTSTTSSATTQVSTTESSSFSFSYPSSTTTTRSYNFPFSTASSTTTVSTTFSQTESYSDTTITSSTISSMFTSTSTNLSPSYEYNSIVATGIAPEVGEVLWYYAGSDSVLGLLSNLASFYGAGAITIYPNFQTILNGAAPGTSDATSASVFYNTAIQMTFSTTSLTSATTTLATSDNTQGGLFTINVSISNMMTVTTTFVVASLSSSSIANENGTFEFINTTISTRILSTIGFMAGSTIFTSTFTFAEEINTSSTSTLTFTDTLSITGQIGTYLQQTTIAVPFEVASIVHVLAASNSFFNSSSSTSAGSTSSWGFTSSESFINTGSINQSLLAGNNLFVLGNLATIGINRPNYGFKLNPSASLVDSIDFGAVIPASFDGSFINLPENQVVPVAYPFARTWSDSNSVHYTAIWDSTGGITMTTASTTSSGTFTTQWNSGASISQPLQDVLNLGLTSFSMDTSTTAGTFGGLIGAGSGSYPGTSMLSNNLQLIQVGYIAGTASNAVTDFYSESFNSDRYVKLIPLAIVCQGITGPSSFCCVADQRTNYNQ